MKSVWFAVSLAVAFSGGCQDPQCSENELKIGKSCRPLSRVDGGAIDEPGAETIRDASVDAAQDIDTGTRDANVPVAADASTSVDDAGSPEEDGAISSEPPAPAAAVCGDGILNGTELCDPKIAAGQAGACPVDCTSTEACIITRVVGDAASCTARCETEPQRACEDADECCPSGCTSANDDDCSASCGNKFVDANETCEQGVGAGCPTSCPAANGCSASMLTGDAKTCSAKCTAFTITALTAGDSCCPAGATAKTDADCAGCGNKKLEPGELCDGNCPTSCDDGDPCTRDAASGSADSCNVKCTHTPVAADYTKTDGLCCGSATAKTDLDCAGCGNKKVETGELCDGNCPTSCDDGNPCTIDTSTGSAGTCDFKCTHANVAANSQTADGICCPGFTPTSDKDCVGCGNGVVEAGEQCDDGNLSDNDGCGLTCVWQDVIPNPAQGIESQGNEIPNRISCGNSTCVTPAEICLYVFSGERKCVSAIYEDYHAKAECDGPEDCTNGWKCVGFETDNNYSANCASPEDIAKSAMTYTYNLYCHNSGQCTSGRKCEPNLSFPMMGSCSLGYGPGTPP